MAMRLLLAEDDRSLGDGIRCGLELDGYALDWLTDGLRVEQSLKTARYDLVVLDLGLPHRSGIEILAGMRAREDCTPVLILTALDGVADRVKGLNSGGDDYLVKPFDLDELSARIRALIRRSHGYAPCVLHHGPFTLDKSAHTLHRGRVGIDLSPYEFILLQMLLDNVGTVLTRNRLEQALYGWDMDVGSNTVEVHVHFLRKKLGDDLIRTVRGVGYTIDKVA